MLSAFLCGLSLFGGALAQRTFTATIDESGQARALLLVDEAFRDEELKVSLLGWDARDSQRVERLPEGLEVSYPGALPASEKPLLPVLLRSTRSPGQLTTLRLTFLIEGGGRSEEATLVVELPRQAIFELEVPERVLAFPERPTTVSVLVSNSGNSAGRAQLSFSGMAATAPSVLLQAGDEKRVRIELPALPTGERSLTITLSGGRSVVRRTLVIVSSGSSRSNANGLATSLSVEGRVFSGEGAKVESESRFSVSTHGQVSRYTFVDALARVDDLSRLTETRVLVRHRNTAVQIDESSSSTPAGNVGRGLYLSHRFTTLPLLNSLVVGAAVPLDGKETTPRFGVMFDSSRVRSLLSVDLAGHELLAEVSADFAPFHVALRYSPKTDATWLARLHYATRDLGLQLEGKYSGESMILSFGTRYRTNLPVAGETGFTGRLELKDLDLHLAQVAAQGAGYRLALVGAPGAVLLVGDFELPLGPGLAVSAALPIVGTGSGHLGAEMNVPAGPLVIALDGSWRSTGVVGAGIEAAYSAVQQNGTFEGRLRVQAHDLLGRHGAGIEAVGTYASYAGFNGKLALAAPLLGPGNSELTLGLRYDFFSASPPGLAEALDGPDPTVRHVRVELEENGLRRPVQGVRLTGCGDPVLTSADGTASLRGPGGSCEVTVDPASLREGLFLADPSISVEPGGTALFTLLPTHELRGLVRYRDVKTGEVLGAGAARDVRVVVEGPVSRWTTASLPSGEFAIRGLPPGEYSARLAGTTSEKSFLLDASSSELLLTVPAPKRTVLDPSSVTPAVRVHVSSFMVQQGEPIRIEVSSPANITSVTIEAAGVSTLFAEPPEVDGSWQLEIPVPANASGALNIDVRVEFEEGQQALRTVQVIVLDAPEPAQTAPREPAPVDQRQRQGAPDYSPLPAIDDSAVLPSLADISLSGGAHEDFIR